MQDYASELINSASSPDMSDPVGSSSYTDPLFAPLSSADIAPIDTGMSKMGKSLWMGPSLRTENPETLEGWDRYNDIIEDPELGFWQSFAGRGRDWLPFYHDFKDANELFDIAGTIRKMKNGDGFISDQEVLNLNIYLAEQERLSRAGSLAFAGAIMRDSLVMATEMGAAALAEIGTASLAPGAEGWIAGKIGRESAELTLKKGVQSLLHGRASKMAANEATQELGEKILKDASSDALQMAAEKGIKDLASKEGSEIFSEALEKSFKNNADNILREVTDGFRNSTKHKLLASRSRAFFGDEGLTLAINRATQDFTADTVGKLIGKDAASSAFSRTAGSVLGNVAQTFVKGAGYTATIGVPAVKTRWAERDIAAAMRGDEESLDSLAAGLFDMWVEYSSEVAGRGLGRAMGKARARFNKLFGENAGLIMSKSDEGKLVLSDFGKKLFNRFGKADAISNYMQKNPFTMSEAARVMRLGGINSYFEEIAEERYGGFIRGIVGLDQDVDESYLDNLVKSTLWEDTRMMQAEAMGFMFIPMAKRSFSMMTQVKDFRQGGMSFGAQLSMAQQLDTLMGMKELYGQDVKIADFGKNEEVDDALNGVTRMISLNASQLQDKRTSVIPKFVMDLIDSIAPKTTTEMVLARHGMIGLMDVYNRVNEEQLSFYHATTDGNVTENHRKAADAAAREAVGEVVKLRNNILVSSVKDPVIRIDAQDHDNVFREMAKTGETADMKFIARRENDVRNMLSLVRVDEDDNGTLKFILEDRNGNQVERDIEDVQFMARADDVLNKRNAEGDVEINQFDVRSGAWRAALVIDSETLFEEQDIASSDVLQENDILWHYDPEGVKLRVSIKEDQGDKATINLPDGGTASVDKSSLKRFTPAQAQGNIALENEVLKRILTDSPKAQLSIDIKDIEMVREFQRSIGDRVDFIATDANGVRSVSPDIQDVAYPLTGSPRTPIQKIKTAEQLKKELPGEGKDAGQAARDFNDATEALAQDPEQRTEKITISIGVNIRGKESEVIAWMRENYSGAPSDAFQKTGEQKDGEDIVEISPDALTLDGTIAIKAGSQYGAFLEDAWENLIKYHTFNFGSDTRSRGYSDRVFSDPRARNIVLGLSSYIEDRIAELSQKQTRTAGEERDLVLMSTLFASKARSGSRAALEFLSQYHVINTLRRGNSNSVSFSAIKNLPSAEELFDPEVKKQYDEYFEEVSYGISADVIVKPKAGAYEVGPASSTAMEKFKAETDKRTELRRGLIAPITKEIDTKFEEIYKLLVPIEGRENEYAVPKGLNQDTVDTSLDDIADLRSRLRSLAEEAKRKSGISSSAYIQYSMALGYLDSQYRALPGEIKTNYIERLDKQSTPAARSAFRSSGEKLYASKATVDAGLRTRKAENFQREVPYFAMGDLIDVSTTRMFEGIRSAVQAGKSFEDALASSDLLKTINDVTAEINAEIDKSFKAVELSGSEAFHISPAALGQEEYDRITTEAAASIKSIVKQIAKAFETTPEEVIKTSTVQTVAQDVGENAVTDYPSGGITDITYVDKDGFTNVIDVKTSSSKLSMMYSFPDKRSDRGGTYSTAVEHAMQLEILSRGIERGGKMMLGRRMIAYVEAKVDGNAVSGYGNVTMIDIDTIPGAVQQAQSILESLRLGEGKQPFRTLSLPSDITPISQEEQSAFEVASASTPTQKASNQQEEKSDAEEAEGTPPPVDKPQGMSKAFGNQKISEEKIDKKPPSNPPSFSLGRVSFNMAGNAKADEAQTIKSEEAEEQVAVDPEDLNEAEQNPESAHDIDRINLELLMSDLKFVFPGLQPPVAYGLTQSIFRSFESGKLDVPILSAMKQGDNDLTQYFASIKAYENQFAVIRESLDSIQNSDARNQIAYITYQYMVKLDAIYAKYKGSKSRYMADDISDLRRNMIAFYNRHLINKQNAMYVQSADGRVVQDSGAEGFLDSATTRRVNEINSALSSPAATDGLTVGADLKHRVHQINEANVNETEEDLKNGTYRGFEITGLPAKIDRKIARQLTPLYFAQYGAIGKMMIAESNPKNEGFGYMLFRDPSDLVSNRTRQAALDDITDNLFKFSGVRQNINATSSLNDDGQKYIGVRNVADVRAAYEAMANGVIDKDSGTVSIASLPIMPHHNTMSKLTGIDATAWSALDYQTMNLDPAHEDYMLAYSTFVDIFDRIVADMNIKSSALFNLVDMAESKEYPGTFDYNLLRSAILYSKLEPPVPGEIVMDAVSSVNPYSRRKTFSGKRSAFEGLGEQYSTTGRMIDYVYNDPAFADLARSITTRNAEGLTIPTIYPDYEFARALNRRMARLSGIRVGRTMSKKPSDLTDEEFSDMLISTIANSYRNTPAFASAISRGTFPVAQLWTPSASDMTQLMEGQSYPMAGFYLNIELALIKEMMEVYSNHYGVTKNMAGFTTYRKHHDRAFQSSGLNVAMKNIGAARSRVTALINEYAKGYEAYKAKMSEMGIEEDRFISPDQLFDMVEIALPDMNKAGTSVIEQSLRNVQAMYAAGSDSEQKKLAIFMEAMNLPKDESAAAARLYDYAQLDELVERGGKAIDQRGAITERDAYAENANEAIGDLYHATNVSEIGTDSESQGSPTRPVMFALMQNRFGSKSKSSISTLIKYAAPRFAEGKGIYDHADQRNVSDVRTLFSRFISAYDNQDAAIKSMIDNNLLEKRKTKNGSEYYAPTYAALEVMKSTVREAVNTTGYSSSASADSFAARKAFLESFNSRYEMWQNSKMFGLESGKKIPVELLAYSIATNFIGNDVVGGESYYFPTRIFSAFNASTLPVRNKIPAIVAIKENRIMAEGLPEETPAIQNMTQRFIDAGYIEHNKYSDGSEGYRPTEGTKNNAEFIQELAALPTDQLLWAGHKFFTDSDKIDYMKALSSYLSSAAKAAIAEIENASIGLQFSLHRNNIQQEYAPMDFYDPQSTNPYGNKYAPQFMKNLARAGKGFRDGLPDFVSAVVVNDPTSRVTAFNLAAGGLAESEAEALDGVVFLPADAFNRLKVSTGQPGDAGFLKILITGLARDAKGKSLDHACVIKCAAFSLDAFSSLQHDNTPEARAFRETGMYADYLKRAHNKAVTNLEYIMTGKNAPPNMIVMLSSAKSVPDNFVYGGSAFEGNTKEAYIQTREDGSISLNQNLKLGEMDKIFFDVQDIRYVVGHHQDNTETTSGPLPTQGKIIFEEMPKVALAYEQFEAEALNAIKEEVSKTVLDSMTEYSEKLTELDAEITSIEDQIRQKNLELNDEREKRKQIVESSSQALDEKVQSLDALYHIDKAINDMVFEGRDLGLPDGLKIAKINRTIDMLADYDPASEEIPDEMDEAVTTMAYLYYENPFGNSKEAALSSDLYDAFDTAAAEFMAAREKGSEYVQMNGPAIISSLMSNIRDAKQNLIETLSSSKETAKRTENQIAANNLSRMSIEHAIMNANTALRSKEKKKVGINQELGRLNVLHSRGVQFDVSQYVTNPEGWGKVAVDETIPLSPMMLPHMLPFIVKGFNRNMQFRKALLVSGPSGSSVALPPMRLSSDGKEVLPAAINAHAPGRRGRTFISVDAANEAEAKEAAFQHCLDNYETYFDMFKAPSSPKEDAKFGRQKGLYGFEYVDSLIYDADSFNTERRTHAINALRSIFDFHAIEVKVDVFDSNKSHVKIAGEVVIGWRVPHDAPHTQFYGRLNVNYSSESSMQVPVETSWIAGADLDIDQWHNYFAYDYEENTESSLRRSASNVLYSIADQYRDPQFFNRYQEAIDKTILETPRDKLKEDGQISDVFASSSRPVNSYKAQIDQMRTNTVQGDGTAIMASVLRAFEFMKSKKIGIRIDSNAVTSTTFTPNNPNTNSTNADIIEFSPPSVEYLSDSYLKIGTSLTSSILNSFLDVIKDQFITQLGITDYNASFAWLLIMSDRGFKQNPSHETLMNATYNVGKFLMSKEYMHYAAATSGVKSAAAKVAIRKQLMKDAALSEGIEGAVGSQRFYSFIELVENVATEMSYFSRLVKLSSKMSHSIADIRSFYDLYEKATNSINSQVKNKFVHLGINENNILKTQNPGTKREAVVMSSFFEMAKKRYDAIMKIVGNYRDKLEVFPDIANAAYGLMVQSNEPGAWGNVEVGQRFEHINSKLNIPRGFVSKKVSFGKSTIAEPAFISGNAKTYLRESLNDTLAGFSIMSFDTRGVYEEATGGMSAAGWSEVLSSDPVVAKIREHLAEGAVSGRYPSNYSNAAMIPVMPNDVNVDMSVGFKSKKGKQSVFRFIPLSLMSNSDLAVYVGMMSGLLTSQEDLRNKRFIHDVSNSMVEKKRNGKALNDTNYIAATMMAGSLSVPSAIFVVDEKTGELVNARGLLAGNEALNSIRLERYGSGRLSQYGELFYLMNSAGTKADTPASQLQQIRDSFEAIPAEAYVLRSSFGAMTTPQINMPSGESTVLKSQGFKTRQEAMTAMENGVLEKINPRALIAAYTLRKYGSSPTVRASLLGIISEKSLSDMAWKAHVVESSVMTTSSAKTTGGTQVGMLKKTTEQGEKTYFPAFGSEMMPIIVEAQKRTAAKFGDPGLFFNSKYGRYYNVPYLGQNKIYESASAAIEGRMPETPQEDAELTDITVTRPTLASKSEAPVAVQEGLDLQSLSIGLRNASIAAVGYNQIGSGNLALEPILKFINESSAYIHEAGVSTIKWMESFGYDATSQTYHNKEIANLLDNAIRTWMNLPANRRDDFQLVDGYEEKTQSVFDLIEEYEQIQRNRDTISQMQTASDAAQNLLKMLVNRFETTHAAGVDITNIHEMTNAEVDSKLVSILENWRDTMTVTPGTRPVNGGHKIVYKESIDGVEKVYDKVFVSQGDAYRFIRENTYDEKKNPNGIFRNFVREGGHIKLSSVKVIRDTNEDTMYNYTNADILSFLEWYHNETAEGRRDVRQVRAKNMAEAERRGIRDKREKNIFVQRRMRAHYKTRLKFGVFRDRFIAQMKANKWARGFTAADVFKMYDDMVYAKLKDKNDKVKPASEVLSDAISLYTKYYEDLMSDDRMWENKQSKNVKQSDGSYKMFMKYAKKGVEFASDPSIVNTVTSKAVEGMTAIDSRNKTLEGLTNDRMALADPTFNAALSTVVRAASSVRAQTLAAVEYIMSNDPTGHPVVLMVPKVRTSSEKPNMLNSNSLARSQVERLAARINLRRIKDAEAPIIPDDRLDPREMFRDFIARVEASHKNGMRYYGYEKVNYPAGPSSIQDIYVFVEGAEDSAVYKRYKKALNHLYDLPFGLSVDKDGNILKAGWSAAVDRMVGYPKYMMVGMRFGAKWGGKWHTLPLSLFHHIALTESFIGLLGPGKFKESIFKSVKLAKESADRMMRDEQYGGVAVKDGLTLRAHNPNINEMSLIEKDMQTMIDNLGGENANGASKAAVKGIGYMLQMMKETDRKLWHNYFNGLKLHAYYSIVDSNMVREVEKNPALAQNDAKYEAKRKEVGQSAAREVNEALGGMNFGEMLMMTPKLRNSLHSAFLSLDWTSAAAGIAGVLDLPGIRFLTGREQGMTGVQKNIKAVYWGTFMLMVLGVIPNIMQAIITGGAKALGGGDPDDDWFIFQHEKAKRGFFGIAGDIDITPLARLAGYDGGKSGKQKIYMKFGKQFHEVPRWFTDTFHAYMSKASAPIQITYETILGENAMGWDMDFKGTGAYGWISGTKDGFAGSRLANILKRGLPLNIRTLLERGDFSYFAPLSRGMSKGLAQEEAAKVLYAYVDDQSFDYIRRKRGAEASVKMALNEILTAAEDNGINSDEVISSARRIVLGGLYNEFYEALLDKNSRKAERISLKIMSIGRTYANTVDSMSAKFEGYNQRLNKVDRIWMRDRFRKYSNRYLK